LTECIASEQSNQLATISKVASAGEALDILTVPQYSPSLQDLPPGTYDFSAQVETDPASISTQVVTELGQYETELDTTSKSINWGSKRVKNVLYLPYVENYVLCIFKV
jgi:hypothetical protein